MFKRLFGSVTSAPENARGQVGDNSGPRNDFGHEIDRTLKFQSTTNRTVAELQRMHDDAYRRAEVIIGHDRATASLLLQRCDTLKKKIANMRNTGHKVTQVSDNAQMLQYNLEAAEVMKDVTDAQKGYLEERGGASAVAANMRNINRVIDDSQRVQEALDDALPQDMFTTEEEDVELNARLDTMEREAAVRMMATSEPVYVAPSVAAPDPARAPAYAASAPGAWEQGHGVPRAQSAPPSQGSDSRHAAGTSTADDYDYYASLLK